MSTETNKTLSRRFFDEVFSKGQMAALDEMYAPEHQNMGPAALPGLPKGPEGMRKLVTFYRTAFPDLHFTIDRQIAEGDTVVTCWTADGTHKGELMGMGIPPSGREVSVSGVSIDRIANGKIVESWGVFDQMGMMQQMGVIPQRSTHS